MDEERAKEALLGESYGGAEGGSEGWRRQGRKKARAARVTGAGGGGRAGPGGQSARPTGAGPGGGQGERSLRAPRKPRGRGRRPSRTQLVARGEEGARPPGWAGRGGEASLKRGSGRKGGRGGLPCPGGLGEEPSRSRPLCGRAREQGPWQAISVAPPGGVGGIRGPVGGTLWLLERARRITGLCSLSLWRGLPGVRKSSRRSPGRPRRRRGGGGGDGGGGAAAGSASGAAAARRPAGVRWGPRPGGTTGSCPGKPRPRCSGWSPSCPRRCRRCSGRRRSPSAVAR